MNITDFTTELFRKVDDAITAAPFPSYPLRQRSRNYVFNNDECAVGFKAPRHRAWAGFEAHLAYAMAGFNILAQWNGLEPDAQGRVHLSIAQFTL